MLNEGESAWLIHSIADDAEGGSGSFSFLQEIENNVIIDTSRNDVGIVFIKRIFRGYGATSLKSPVKLYQDLQIPYI